MERTLKLREKVEVDLFDLDDVTTHSLVGVFIITIEKLKIQSPFSQLICVAKNTYFMNAILNIPVYNRDTKTNIFII